MAEMIVGYVFSKRENYRKKVLTMPDDKLKDLIKAVEQEIIGWDLIGRCPNCGASVNSTMEHCDNCGQPLSWGD